MVGSHSRSCDTWAGLTLLVIAKATLIQRSWITLPGVFVQKTQPSVYLGALQAAYRPALPQVRNSKYDIRSKTSQLFTVAREPVPAVAPLS